MTLDPESFRPHRREQRALDTIAGAASEQPKLTPKVHALVKEYLDKNNGQLCDLVDALGSPLNLLFPQIVSENVRAFRAALSKLSVQGRIYFAP